MSETHIERPAATRDLSAAIDPLDDTEARHRAQVLDWIDSDAPLWRTAKPATPPMHLVSYAVVIDPALKPAIVADHLLPDLTAGAGARRSGCGTVDAAVADRIAAADLARAIRNALSHPPAAFVERFPPRPAIPWLADRWDAALRAVTTYRHTWGIVGPVGDGIIGLLGPEPEAGGAQHQEWTAATDTVVRHALNITLRLLADAGWSARAAEPRHEPNDDDRQPTRRQSSRTWAIDYLQARIADGAITPAIDVRSLASWLNEATDARAEAGLADDDPLPPATSPGTNRLHVLLRLDPVRPGDSPRQSRAPIQIRLT